MGWLLAFSIFILAKRFNNWSDARLPWAFSRSTEHGWKTEVRLPYKLCCGGPRAWEFGRGFPKQYVHCPARTWLTELYHCDLSGCAGDRRLTWWNWVFPLAQIVICMSSALLGRKKHLLQLNRDNHWAEAFIIRVQSEAGKQVTSCCSFTTYTGTCQLLPQHSVHLHFMDRWQLQHNRAGQTNEKGLKHAENGNCAFLLLYGASLKDTIGFRVSIVITS